MVNYIKISVLLLFISSCSSFQLNKHDGFWEWFIGKPGFTNTLGISDEPRDGVVLGDRYPIYLWLRTPEIIFNPQGGLYYPDMVVELKNELYKTTELSQIKDRRIKYAVPSRRNSAFHAFDTGIIDGILQYRELNDPSSKTSNVILRCIIFPIWFVVIYPMRLIAYPVHDVLKTAMIPVAVVYYTVKSDENEEEEK
ncbi:MAG: hypothetical protein KDK90_27850 [Leptospiraceae bacterium]|nr:hypothetical protein [Leptospiraceae bacterium]